VTDVGVEEVTANAPVQAEGKPLRTLMYEPILNRGEVTVPPDPQESADPDRE
jgi:hypothetical protein